MKKLLAVLLALILLFGKAVLAEKSLAPYPSLKEIYKQAKSLAWAYDFIQIEEIGRSVEARPIYVLRYRLSSEQVPQALITAGIHACEYIGVAVAMNFAKELAEKAQSDEKLKELLQKVEIDIVPVINPDGYERVWRTGGKGGKIGTRKNAHGVDLNRNFLVVPGAKSWHPLAGNRRPRSNYYMGPEPLSEPETKAISKLVKSGHYFVAFNLHSVAGKFLYPYSYTKKPAPHKKVFIEIGKAFTSAQKYHSYKIQQSCSWYPTLGDLDDYLYLWFGIPSFTIEVSTVKSNLFDQGLRSLKVFWIMNPKKKYSYWVENDTSAFIPAIIKAYELTGGKTFPAKFKQ